MPRSPGLWLRSRDKVWMTTVNGSQIRLSPDKAEARRLFHKLMAADGPARSPGVTCRRLLDTYLAKTAAGRSPDRERSVVRYLGRFCKAFGHRRGDSLKPHEVDAWLDAQPGSDSTRAFALACVRAGFRWAHAQGYVPADPLAGVAARRVAARKRLVTDAEVDAVLAKCTPGWRDYFLVLRLTGMRPVSEAAALTAAHLDPALRRACFVKHKTAKKTGRPRVVYFPPGAWAMVVRLAERRPTGPLFRTEVDTAITVPRANQYLRRQCDRAGLVPFPPYCLRHKMITEALAKGVPVDVLGAVVGNSARVIRTNYSHLADDSMAGVLAAAAAKAVS